MTNEEKLENLKRAIQEGLDSGIATESDLEEFLDKMKDREREKKELCNLELKIAKIRKDHRDIVWEVYFHFDQNKKIETKKLDLLIELNSELSVIALDLINNQKEINEIK